MRLKKFYEYARTFTKEDLAMWLRIGDSIKINCFDGVHKNGVYTIVDIDEDEIVLLSSTNKSFSLAIEELNDRWELESINGDLVTISERKSINK